MEEKAGVGGVGRGKRPPPLNTCSLAWSQKGTEHFKVEVSLEMEGVCQ